MEVNYGIVSIHPFRIDIPLSSESVQFGIKMARVEPDDKILRLPYLPLG